MATYIPVDVFRRELLDLLDETFENTKGIYLDRDTSLFETLNDLSAGQASKAISPRGATIAGHVEHMRFYLDVLTGCIRRESVEKIDWQDSWQLTEVDEQEWAATKQRLQDAYHNTLEAIKTLDLWEGEDNIGASLAILAHTASHLGSIRQALHIVK